MEKVVYQIRNLVNGKRYIGSSVKYKYRVTTHIKSLREKRHHSPKLQRAWDKYGEDNFEFSILAYADSKFLLITLEQFYIQAFNAVNYGYNICPIAGSAAGRKLSEEHKRKIALANTGRVYGKRQPFSEERKLKMSLAQIGKKASEEARKNMSIAQRKRIRPPRKEKVPIPGARVFSPSHKEGLKRAWKSRMFRKNGDYICNARVAV